MKKIFREILQCLLISGLLSLLCLPLVVLKVDVAEELIDWQWDKLLWVAIYSFTGTCLWRLLKHHPSPRLFEAINTLKKPFQPLALQVIQHPAIMSCLLLSGLIFLPWILSPYQVSIMTTALMYVVLGLGLNIVVGLAGLLDLGYVAFYAVGAYSYALFHEYFGLGFWAILPVGGILAGLTGILLGIPVLRLRGDYLAIVTLGFGEIIRLVLENWSEVTKGPQGVSGIPSPDFPVHIEYEQVAIYMYLLMLMMVTVTIVVVKRLDHSRIGRAWIALREDELACQAMGIDTTRTKLRAFALGACWAGFVGVFFAAKNSFVNPHSFTFMQSAIILCIVVLGGMGSITGVILAALFLILIPEYLRFMADYRMLVFGAAMVVVMVFKPEGLISNVRRRYELHEEQNYG
ncbi:MAG: branched-chain amino acid ABC transporter permease [SAR324 cluster bacterium]|nr:branched-chain amino acid ABC transporter permease [SAR324 cluster bacterium]